MQLNAQRGSGRLDAVGKGMQWGSMGSWPGPYEDIQNSDTMRQLPLAYRRHLVHGAPPVPPVPPPPPHPPIVVVVSAHFLYLRPLSLSFGHRHRQRICYSYVDSLGIVSTRVVFCIVYWLIPGLIPSLAKFGLGRVI